MTDFAPRASASPQDHAGLTLVAHRSLWRDALDRLLANKLAVVGLIIVLALFVVAIIGPQLAPYDYLAQNIRSRYQSPSAEHWLGTDGLGRDMLSRLIYGARYALLVAFSVTAFSLMLGTALGAIAGYSGGKVDAFIVWLCDLVMSIPSLLLIVVVSVSLRRPVTYWMEDMYLATKNPIFRETTWIEFALVFGALAIVRSPRDARLIRGQILSIRHKNYVLAAHALGIPRRKILLSYVIPNALGPVIVAASASLGEAMVLESAFSFLGVGMSANVPSWGNMIREGLRLWQTYPYLLAIPAAVLATAALAFNFLGDGLNDALNPRQWQ